MDVIRWWWLFDCIVMLMMVMMMVMMVMLVMVMAMLIKTDGDVCEHGIAYPKHVITSLRWFARVYTFSKFPLHS